MAVGTPPDFDYSLAAGAVPPTLQAAFHLWTPLPGKGKRWGRCCAWSDAVICPAFDAAGRQPPACMGVRGPGPDHPKRARSTVASPCAYRLCHPNVVPMETA